MTPEEKNRILMRAWKSKIASTRRRRNKDGTPIEMRLTFEEWCRLWQDHGTLPGSPWVISRHNDQGHYEIGNVTIVHNVDNVMQTYPTKQTDLDIRITQYSIQHRISRRTVKAMLARGQIQI